MKKLIFLSALFCSVLANARVSFFYDEPVYYEEVYYPERDYYAEEVIYDDYDYVDCDDYDYCVDVTPLYVERPVVKRIHYYNNPVTNFFSGLFSFCLGTAVGAAISK